MRDKLRRRYQVEKEVTRNGCFEGEIGLSELSRLSDLLHPEQPDLDDRTIKVSFEFVRDEYDSPMITGQLDTSLKLECQRCLQPLEVPIVQEFRLLIDASDELLRASSLDTLYSEAGCIDINAVVEDEIILSIPLVVLHPDSGCNRHWPAASEESVDRENPFALLRQLKTTD